MPYPDYTSLPKYANILHLYKLDELSGTRSDFIATCHLKDNNTVLYGTGKIGNAADFELNNAEYLSADSTASSDMNFTSGNFSISFWLKPESLLTAQILCVRSDNVDGWDMYYDQSIDSIRFRLVRSTGKFAISNTGILATDTWVHLTIVRNGATGYIYKNGSDNTSASETFVNPNSVSTTFSIGDRTVGSSVPTDGLIDEFTVWNVALSSAEVSTLYNWYSKVGLSGAISFVGTLQKKPKKLLEGAITFSGNLYRKLFKTLTGNISFTGTLSSIKNKIDDVWKFIVKRTTTWTGQDKETTTWTAQDKEDTDWTTT